MIETLIKLGLSEKEAAVYLAALELGEDTAQNIAEKSQVNRATTYVILEKLIKLGLVSTVERGKKTAFIAEDPHELANIFEAQRREIDERKRLLADSMSQLQAVHNASQKKPIVRFFEGADGLEALDRYGHDQIKPNSEYLGIIPVDIVEEQFPRRRSAAVNDRVERGIRSLAIYTHKDGAVMLAHDPANLRESRFLSRDVFPITGSITIYPEWGVKFFDFDPHVPVGVLIQSPAIANNMKELFKLAWQSQEPESAN